MPSTRLVSCGSWRRMGRPSVTVLLCLRCGFDLFFFPFLICSCQVKPGDRAHNQAHYEALGEVNKNLELSVYVFANIQFAQVITDEVYNILETEGGLERREVVLEDGRKERPRSFVFASPGFQEKERLQVEKLQSSLILQLYFRC